MASPRSDTGAKLARRWKLGVKHALYRRTGDWYHQLERFPGALLDPNGYVIFETEEAFQSCPQLVIRQDVAVPHGGIKTIPGYTSVSEGTDAPVPQTSHEKTLALEGARVDVVQSRPERDPVA